MGWLYVHRTWDVPRSKAWGALLPLRQDPALPPVAAGPILTAFYKHLLNIRPEDEDEDERFRSMPEKDWASFRTTGFADQLQPKLQFDLLESERVHRKAKRNTLEWSAFAQSGFAERETFLAQDLVFDPALTTSVSSSGERQKQIGQKVRKMEKACVPPFLSVQG
jgi:hypothetical protein